MMIAAGLVSGALIGSSASNPANATTGTTTTVVARLTAKAAIPEPVAVVTALEDEDGDGVADSVPGSPSNASSAPVVSVNGWRCPVPIAKFTNDWGAARSGGRSHAGTDLLAPRGTPILAPIAGVVKFDSSSRGGLSFYLDSPNGMQLYGAHLEAVGASGKVESGAIVGYVGDSGNAKGTTHLHFEIHPSKHTKTNPYPLLKQIC